MHYTYILFRNDEEWYIGYTADLQRRYLEHQKEYTCKLVYYEAYRSEKLARQREKKLKYYDSAWRALKKRIIA